MGFDEIINTLKELLSHFGLRKDRRMERTVKDEELPEFKGWQAPLKQWENSGNYSPGVATDKRHPGGHNGIDMRAPLGSPIYPMAPGRVKSVYEDPKGGLAIVISHPQGVSSYSAHCNSVNVKPGDVVDYNTVVGAVGYSGNAHPSRGGGMPHIHLQTWLNGVLTNPSKFFLVKPYKPFDPNTEVLMLPGVKPRPEPPQPEEKMV